MLRIVHTRLHRRSIQRGLAAVAAATFAAATVAYPGPAHANPNPARITDASWWLMQQLLQLEPSSQNGGIYANKPGYHNTRAANSSGNYSVRDAEDQGGPSDKAAAYDWTFPEAQSLAALPKPGVRPELPLPAHVTSMAPNYSRIARYSSRLLASGQNPNDPRLDGWREFFGQADSDNAVEGWDFRYDRAVSSDSSHLWHIHLSEDRDKVTSYDNKRALLSVLRGETVEEWRNGPRRGNSVTGDPFADVLAVDGAGDLWLYSNNFLRDGGVPYSGGRRQVGNGWDVMTWIMPADVTGDGFTDVLAVDGAGDLWLYSNNFLRDGGVPYGGGRRQVGHGWGGYAEIMPADVTGDGFTDVLAVDTAGDLWLYSNNFLRDGGVPYNGGRRQVGHGWDVMTRIMPADVTGDGFTDLLAVDSAGDLWLYSNNFLRDGGVPYGGGRRQVGNGWGGFADVVPADVTGDGFTDVLAVDGAGDMWLYSNNFLRDGGLPYSGGSRKAGHGWTIYDRILV